jgi:CubicO group peptidase (beta-lactamase class C family)
MNMTSRFKASAAVCYAVLLLSALSCPAIGQQDHAARIKEVLTLANKYGQFNGSALVAENGKIILKEGFGSANMEWGIPNTPQTKFRLGSITKQFTAMLTLQLMEKGMLRLDGKLADYLPDYRKDVAEKVTIHHLLTHTSGIPSYTSLPGFFEDVSRNPYKVSDFVKKYASGDLEFEPGSKFSYNNSGYFLLGAVIERLTGKAYEQVLKENILEPLGMTNTGYDHNDAIIEKRASGYVRTPDGYSNARYLDMSIPYAAGSIYSTVEDLYLWDQALYANKLISANSAGLMYTPFLENYAYGWAISTAPFQIDNRPVQIVKHDGGINGFSTIIVRYVGQKHLIVLLDNTSQGMYLDPLSTTIGNILYNRPADLPKLSVADALLRSARDKDATALLAQYRELRAKQAASYDFSEGQLNRVGYELLRSGKLKDAIEIFKLNVEVYPKSFNAYDSLGEAYVTNGETAIAAANYRKSLELNPHNDNAARILKRLNGQSATVEPGVSGDYVGEYQFTPGSVVTVFREGERLMMQATGQPKAEMIPDTEATFFLRVVDAKVSFDKNSKGQVTGIVVHQGGKEVPGKKIK